MTSADVHRRPGEESLDLYPGLVVSDGEHSRQGGSITIGRTRLPIWAFIGRVIARGWNPAVQDYYGSIDYSTFSEDSAAEFFHSLMDHRGEFARLILILADVERCSTARWDWTETPKQRKRLADQLRKCLDKLSP